MGTYSLQLLDFPGKYEGEGLPYGPKAWIGLKTWTTGKLPVKGSKEKADFYLITPDCIAFREIDDEINSLIKELETIRKQAKRFFKKDNEKRDRAARKWAEQSLSQEAD